MLKYFIVCPLVFLAGLVDSIAGGGGLVSLPAYLLAGIPAHMAIGTNKLSSAAGTAVSTGRFLKHGYVPLRLSLPAAAMALLGAHLGAKLSLLVSEAVLRGMLLVVLPVAAAYVLRGQSAAKERPARKPGQLLAIAMASALVIGVYDGFYGPGTGTFLLLLLTGPGRMDLKSAAGTTKVINLTSNVSALVTFLLNGQVYWALGLAASLFSVAGHFVGSGLVVRDGKRIVRPVILTVLALLFVKVAWSFLHR